MTKCEEVILNEEKRGKGIPGDPIRLVVQVYTKEGMLIAENDPFFQYNDYSGKAMMGEK